MPISISGNGTITGNVSFGNTVTLSSVTATSVSANSINSASYVSANSVVIAPIGYALGPQTMKNRIINGDMRIDQRFSGAANTSINGASQYVIDRWAGYSNIPTGKLRFQQNNTNGPGSSATQTATGFSNYFGANTTSSNTVNSTDLWLTFQCIEGYNIADLNWGTANASPITLSFWSYSSIAGTHGGVVQNGPQTRSYVFSYNITTANTWQYQTITIPGDTTGSWWSNNNIGMYVLYNLGTGSTYLGSPNSWGSTTYFAPTGSVQVVNNANGSFYLTGVQLEKGTQATSFDWRHYGYELSLCQRYYCKTYNQGTNPGATTTSGFIAAIPSSTSFYEWIGMKWPVVMRTTPLITIYSPTTGAAGYIRNYSTTADVACVVPTASDNNFMGLNFNPTVGNLYFAHVVASAELNTQN